MIVSRMVSLFLRFAQFVCSAIVLGLVAYFLHQRDKYGVGPLGRSIYTEIVAALSVIFSLIWMIPTTSSIINYATDLFFSAAWFAAFGALVDWYYDVNCGSIWHWGGIRFRGGNYCSKWNAAQAFSFLAAIFWFASFLLGIIVYHKLSRPVATDGTHGRRWRRSHV
ncbi:integral membrane protein [Trematosphaeria pertusa]|uniref:Integral membrane protein n=1 Tax=Trematosphaeria pertusa TaxID=390896 RepID=A0A6A6IZQ8_9PLEO|nr:uncharacterized protein BU26DRAFT_559695 [Trematosphaeria pertusa]KAF2255070.1 integral membrane protein [Trematosphaeria pertusa]